MTRATELYKISNSRENNYMCRKNYWLNGAVRRLEQPANETGENFYSKALFYMYGNCERVGPDVSDGIPNQTGDTVLVHSLLKRFSSDGQMPASEAKQYLKKQIVVKGSENDTNDLSNEE